MIKGLYSGAGFRLNGQTVPGIPGYNPDMPALKYDPERAKALLAEAGFPGGKGMPPIDIQCTEPFKDEITYDTNDLNGLAWNVTTKSKGAMQTPVDRKAPLDLWAPFESRHRYVFRVPPGSRLDNPPRDRAVRSKWSRSNLVAVGASRPMVASKIRRCSVLMSRGGAEIDSRR